MHLLPSTSAAFVAPLFLAPGRAAASRRPAICMKTGSPNGKASKSNRAAKPTAGTGFGMKVQKKEEEKVDNVATDSDASASQSETADSREGEAVEKTSGAQGDATPKRILIPKSSTDGLVDPLADKVQKETPEVVQLPTLSAEQRAELLLPRNMDPDKIIEAFADARGTDRFAALVVANRHLISNDVLYRFTSAILQTEGRTTNVETREEEAKSMRKFRQEIIAHTWSYDLGFKIAVQRAEKRLVPVLQSSSVGADVNKAAGNTRMDVNAFWTVIYAAVAAWEERGQENPDLANVDMQKALAEAAEACRESSNVINNLSPCLAVIQDVLAQADPKAQQEALAKLTDEDIDELGTLLEAILLLPTQAYGGLAKRLGKIVGFIRADRFGIPSAPARPLRFNMQDIERTSRLVAFASRSENVRRRE